MSIYTPSEVRQVPFDTPDDGDDVDAASVGIGLEALADGLEWASVQVEKMLVPLTRNVSCARVQGVAAVAGAVDGLADSTLDFQVIPPTTALLKLTGDSLYPAAAYGGAGGTKRRRYIISLDDAMIDGATLSSAVLRFTTFVTHAAVPVELPQIAIYRRALASTVLTGYGAYSTLLSTGNGYATLATPASVAAYEVENTITFTPNQNNVIDRATYRYFACIGDEARTNATDNSNAYHTISLNFAAPPDARRS